MSERMERLEAQCLRLQTLLKANAVTMEEVRELTRLKPTTLRLYFAGTAPASGPTLQNIENAVKLIVMRRSEKLTEPEAAKELADVLFLRDEAPGDFAIVERLARLLKEDRTPAKYPSRNTPKNLRKP